MVPSETLVGSCLRSRRFLFGHIDFNKFDGDRVIKVNVLTDPQQAIDFSKKVKDVKVGVAVCCSVAPPSVYKLLQWLHQVCHHHATAADNSSEVLRQQLIAVSIADTTAQAAANQNPSSAAAVCMSHISHTYTSTSTEHLCKLNGFCTAVNAFRSPFRTV